MSETNNKNEKSSIKEDTGQRVKKQDDGSVTVILKKPLKRKTGKHIKSITLDEPDYTQLEEFGLEDLDKIAVLPVLIPRISREEIYETDFKGDGDIKAMGISDLIALSMALTAFI